VETDTETVGTEMDLTTTAVCGEVQPGTGKLRMLRTITADQLALEREILPPITVVFCKKAWFNPSQKQHALLLQ
jgi:hypothetical protein